MPDIFGYSLTKAEIRIMNYLYRVRGAKVEQIVRGVNLFPTLTSSQNTHKFLRALRIKKLVTNTDLPSSHEKLYYLSGDGYYLAKLLKLNTTKIKIKGTGFHNDVGHFAYNQYVPPKVYTSHFLMHVDFDLIIRDLDKRNRWNFKLKKGKASIKRMTNICALINKKRKLKANTFRIANIRAFVSKTKLRELSRKLLKTENVIKYRDNMHSERKLEVNVKGNKHAFYLRPDGEVFINNRQYFIEYDLSTERRKALIEKFKGYKRYFDSLKKENKPLPQTILFITNEFTLRYGMQIRWGTISSAFYEVLKDYATEVNLTYKSLVDVKAYMQHEISYPPEYHFPIIKKVYDRCIANKQTILGNSTGTLGHLLYSFTRAEDSQIPDYKHPLYLHVKVEGCETRGWMIAHQIKKQYEDEKTLKKGTLYKFKEIIPVFSFLSAIPEQVGVPILEPFKDYFESGYIFNLTKQTIQEEQITLPDKRLVDIY
ncbi:replication-relaxation family protein [Bacillus sp. FJAT-29937]|uniref:replication-relaxation family protein n=1 Tax=Bacillus sp. FJAT-29937 TaxID=1720553 RepID=UPI00082C733A|nr:replication-relaxation family protein [Bacillus sp. FJAT-29937]